MSPDEWWWVFDAKRTDRDKPVPGCFSLTENDLEELYALLP